MDRLCFASSYTKTSELGLSYEPTADSPRVFALIHQTPESNPERRPQLLHSLGEVVMRLSSIEIVVGGQTEAPETRRRLCYLVSFRNEGRQSRCRCVHEMWIPERALCDPDCIARVVAHVVSGLMSEFAGSELGCVEEPGGVLPLL